jgi:DNA (cytosine-5)-methyltransferase 1|tara:strand:- start:14 stop:1051 length:1038 start_codon:yes stop_codon:yes gene_type:complete
MKKYNLIDIFSGIGGFHTGFLKTNRFHLLYALDNNENCKEFHKINHPDLNFKKVDLSKIDERQYWKNKIVKEVDVLIGGPPCQGFSTIGNRASSNSEKREKYDIRNNLIGHFINNVNVLRPKCFIMENVRGLTTYRKGYFFDDVMEEFKKIPDYTFNYKVLNAADYGVPQIRNRTFIIGTRLKINEFRFPNPTHFENKSDGIPYETVGGCIMDLVGKENKINNHVPLKHRETNIARYKLIPEGGRMPEDKLPLELYRKNFGNTFKRLDRKKPALTMVPGHNAFPIHPTENRSLTVREAARIQTFSDDFIFTGTRQSQCIQVGNAVPPLLSEKLALHLLKILDGKN